MSKVCNSPVQFDCGLSFAYIFASCALGRRLTQERYCMIGLCLLMAGDESRMAGGEPRMAGGEPRMTGDCCRADGIQPDLYIDTYARIHTCL